MSMSVRSILLAICAVPSVALAAPPCAGLQGVTRASCLQQEVERSRRETARIDAYNRNLDKTKEVVCTGRDVASTAAGSAGASVAGAGGYVAGQAVSRGSQYVGDRILQNGGCTKRAR